MLVFVTGPRLRINGQQPDVDPTWARQHGVLLFVRSTGETRAFYIYIHPCSISMGPNVRKYCNVKWKYRFSIVTITVIVVIIWRTRALEKTKRSKLIKTQTLFGRPLVNFFPNLWTSTSAVVTRVFFFLRSSTKRVWFYVYNATPLIFNQRTLKINNSIDYKMVRKFFQN